MSNFLANLARRGLGLGLDIQRPGAPVPRGVQGELAQEGMASGAIGPRALDVEEFVEQQTWGTELAAGTSPQSDRSPSQRRAEIHEDQEVPVRAEPPDRGSPSRERTSETVKAPPRQERVEPVLPPMKWSRDLGPERTPLKGTAPTRDLERGDPENESAPALFRDTEKPQQAPWRQEPGLPWPASRTDQRRDPNVQGLGGMAQKPGKPVVSPRAEWFPTEPQKWESVPIQKARGAATQGNKKDTQDPRLTHPSPGRDPIFSKSVMVAEGETSRPTGALRDSGSRSPDSRGPWVVPRPLPGHSEEDFGKMAGRAKESPSATRSSINHPVAAEDRSAAPAQVRVHIGTVEIQVAGGTAAMERPPTWGSKSENAVFKDYSAVRSHLFWRG